MIMKIETHVQLNTNYVESEVNDTSIKQFNTRNSKTATQ